MIVRATDQADRCTSDSRDGCNPPLRFALLVIELVQINGITFVKTKKASNAGLRHGSEAIEIDDADWRKRLGRLRGVKEQEEEREKKSHEESVSPRRTVLLGVSSLCG